MRIVTDPNMTKTVEDWSKVRSPSRAIRRMKRGYRQNVRTIAVPMEKVFLFSDPFGRPVVVCHPESRFNLGICASLPDWIVSAPVRSSVSWRNLTLPQLDQAIAASQARLHFPTTTKFTAAP